MLDLIIRDHGGVQSISVIADTVGHTSFEHTPQDHKPLGDNLVMTEWYDPDFFFQN